VVVDASSCGALVDGGGGRDRETEMEDVLAGRELLVAFVEDDFAVQKSGADDAAPLDVDFRVPMQPHRDTLDLSCPYQLLGLRGDEQYGTLWALRSVRITLPSQELSLADGRSSSSAGKTNWLDVSWCTS
jgi:hypothetical protein